MKADLRAFFSSKSSELGDEASMYKLGSGHKIFGFYNCQILNLDFERGEYEGNLLFQPVNEMKPIILACCELGNDCNFFILDSHLTNKKERGMINFKPFESSEYMVLCSTKSGYYWSIRKKDLTFVFSQKSIQFENTHSVDLDTLCAFVGGEITLNQLQAQSYLASVEQIKEIKREEHIRELTTKLDKRTAELAYIREQHTKLGEMFSEVYGKNCILGNQLLLIKFLTDTPWPVVNKQKILELLKD